MNGKCPICKNSSTNLGKMDRLKVNCDRCGKFIIHEMLLGDEIDYELKKLNKQNYMLSGILREIKEFGKNKDVLPEVYPLTIKDFFDSYKIPKTVSEKLDKFLLYIEKRTSCPGSDITIVFERDYPVAYASGGHEIRYLLNLLKDLQYVKIGANGRSCCIDIAGWKRLEEIKKVNPDSKICFTAMSFDNEDKDIFDKGILLGAKDAGYDAKRVDTDEHNNQITDQMIVLIKQSKFVIADFTRSDKKGGIYYEAGFAKGLGLPVIFTCEEKYFDGGKGLHFDIRQENHILWKNTEDLRKKLKGRIEKSIK